MASFIGFVDGVFLLAGNGAQRTPFRRQRRDAERLYGFAGKGKVMKTSVLLAARVLMIALFIGLATLCSCVSRGDDGPRAASDGDDDTYGGPLTVNGDGTATDSSSGLTWQQEEPAEDFEWGAASVYCDNLALAGGGWRLPKIEELRTLIRGCDAMAPGGACGVSDSCLNSSCWNGACLGCSGDPSGATKCYEPPELRGDCAADWSSSYVTDSSVLVWEISFNYPAGIGSARNFFDRARVRCVR